MIMGPNRIKLLKFVTAFAFGGTERHVVSLAQGLDPSRFELHMGCLRSAGVFVGEIRARGIPLVEYKISSLYHPNTLKEQLRLARYVRRNRIQIVHSYGLYSNVFAIPAARLGGASVVVASIRDMGDVWSSLQRHAQKFVCRLADCILVNAEAVRERLIAEGYRPEKTRVIRNGIPLSRFGAQPNGVSVREELGLPSRGPLVAMLSVLRRRKGIEYFLEAARLVSRYFQDARFLVVGDSVYKEAGYEVGDSAYKRELERYAQSLGLDGHVVFTGFRRDVPALLSEVAVSVQPSLSEGLSNVLLESMAAGVPVVATRVGGNPEVVVDGVTGLLVPPQDAGALADAICRLLANPELASRFGHAARGRVAEQFSLERMVRETEDFYLSALV